MAKINRRYLDLRNGWVVFPPIFGLSNTLMLLYITFVNEIIPLWLFSLVAVPSVIVTLIIIGNLFRKKQMNTDLDLSYQRATQAGKTVYHMMKRINDITKALNLPEDKTYDTQTQYMKDIADNKFKK